MKKSLIIALAVVLAIGLAGCGTKPETAIDNFFGAVKNFDSESMTKALAPSTSGDTKELGSMDEYLKSTDDPMSAPFVDYLKGNAKKITYEITNTKVNGDAATVTVKCKYVDGTQLFDKIIQDLFAKALSSAFSGKEMTQEEMTKMGADLLKQDIASVKETFVEKTVDIDCVKVDGTWYVKEVNDDLADVVTCNLLTAAKNLADSFGQ